MVEVQRHPARPDWVSEKLYPFTSRYFQAPRGGIHYVDEGAGRPVVFVHGNPSWSFEYRHLIAGLRDGWRCIAPDHLGFGLSARSTDKADWHPKAHAENFAALMEHLELEGVVLVMSDWGGPIALDFARRQPERVAGLVILNTWCWPVDRDWHFKGFSYGMSSWLGQYLILRHNFFVKGVMPKGVVDRRVLTDAVLAHYANAQPDPQARRASAALPGYILGATDWLADIWADRAAFAAKPALVLWGGKDIAFRHRELEVWQEALGDCEVQAFPQCGHFLAEEAPEAVGGYLRRFLEGRGLKG